LRHLVNGKEAELESGSAQVTRLSDRLVATTGDGSHTALSVRQGDAVLVSYRGRQYVVERAGVASRAGKATNSGDARAPMPGQIVEVFVAVGDRVEAGQRLLVLEAKMQHTMKAPFAGTVESLPVQAGDQVAGGQVLVHVEPAGQ
jgi:biotin carboxyl carrier protein